MSYIKQILKDLGLDQIYTKNDIHRRALILYGKNRSGWTREDWLLVIDDVIDRTDEEVKKIEAKKFQKKCYQCIFNNFNK